MSCIRVKGILPGLFVLVSACLLAIPVSSQETKPAPPLDRDGIEITIGDEGEGFDARTLPDPFAPQGLLRGSGRGVYLAKALMDEHRVQSRNGGGTQITLIKHSHQQECVEDVRRRLGGRM